MLNELCRPLLDAVLQGKPGRPDIARVEGTSVSLEWTAPEDSGQGVITGYVINIYVISGSNADRYDTEHVDEMTTFHTISGRLQQQTWYKFAVAAKTEVGEGSLSDLSYDVQTNRGCYL